MPNYPTDSAGPNDVSSWGAKSVNNITDLRDFKDVDTNDDGNPDLSNVTDTIGDFSNITETVPTLSSWASTPATILGKLGKEISRFQDALDPRRTYVAVTKTCTSTAAAGTITMTAAHGLVADTPVKLAVASTRDQLVAGTVYFVKATGLTSTAFKVSAAPGDGTALTATDDTTDFTVTIAQYALASSDTIYYSGHGLSNGQTVRFATAVTGLSTSTTYYVIGATTNTFQVSTSLNGSAVNISADGEVVVAPVLTAAELSYVANMLSIKLNDLTATALKTAFELKRLTAQVNNINSTGPLASSRYPSGDQY